MPEGDKVTLAGVVTYDHSGNNWVEIQFAEGSNGRAIVPRSTFASASGWWDALRADVRGPLEWLKSVHCHAARPPSNQRDVLTALAVRFADWDSGEAEASVEELVDFCGVARSTVQRALWWAMGERLLVRASRGHRLGNGESVASRYELW